MVTVTPAERRRRMVTAYRRMCDAETAARTPRDVMFAALEYLGAVLVTMPDAALSADPAASLETASAGWFRSEVLALAARLRLTAEFQECDHSRAEWLPDPGVYLCPACQGQRGPGDGESWSL